MDTGEGLDKETGEEVCATAAGPTREKVTGEATTKDGRDEARREEEQVRESAGQEPSAEPGKSDASPQPEEEARQTGDKAENGPKSDTGDESEGSGDDQTQDSQPKVTTRLGSWLKCFSDPEWIEQWQLIKLTLGLGATEFLVFLIGFISTMMCSRLGSTELASASLAVMLFNICAVSISIGLAQTFNTLISQTYGSGNLLRVGVILQRAALFSVLCCFLSWSVLLCSEPIALRLGHAPEVARLTQQYIYILMPAVPASFMYQLEVKYLQNQEWVRPQLITGITANIFNILINYVMTYLQLGLLWSAAGMLFSHYSLALILFIIITVEGLHKPTWPGWSLDCLQEWGSFSVTALFSVFMVVAELWAFEGWLYIASCRGELILEAQTVIYYVYIAFVTIPMALSAATSVQVGNALGANDVDRAERSCVFSLKCAGVILALFAPAMYFLIPPFASLLTSDPATIEILSKDDIVVFAFAIGVDSATSMVSGMFRGVGSLGVAFVFTVTGQIIGIALSNGLSVEQGIRGIGGGFLWGLGIQLLLSFGPISNLVKSLKLLAKEAQVTAGVIKDKMEVTNIGPSAQSDQQVQARGATVVGEVLSTKQLVQRRGFAVFLVLVILVAAVIVRNYTLKLNFSGKGFQVLSS